MALKNAFGGLALDETLKQMIAKFRDWQDPTWVTSHPDSPLHTVGKNIGQPDPSIASTIRVVTALTTATILVPANNNRSALSIYNASTAAVLYILASLAPTVTSTLCTIPLGIGDYWELPQGVGGCYKGAIQGIWASASGTCVITEYS